MKLLDKLKDKKKSMQAQMQRGREVTGQMKADKMRKKMDNLIHMKPGARQAITHGLMMRKKPLDVMKEEYSRRLYEREQKKKEKKA